MSNHYLNYPSKGNSKKKPNTVDPGPESLPSNRPQGKPVSNPEPTKYMELPKRVPLKEVMLPVGTRIRFLKDLTSGPDEFGPGNLYANEGDLGEVTGHGCWEGHWVKWDKWDAPFGAVHGVDFVKA